MATGSSIDVLPIIAATKRESAAVAARPRIIPTEAVAAVSQELTNQGGACRAERHSNRRLARTLTRGVSDQSVHTNAGNQYRHHRKDTQRRRHQADSADIICHKLCHRQEADKCDRWVCRDDRSFMC